MVCKNNTHNFEPVCVIRKIMESMPKGKNDCKLKWALSLSACFLAIYEKGQNVPLLRSRFRQFVLVLAEHVTKTQTMQPEDDDHVGYVAISSFQPLRSLWKHSSEERVRGHYWLWLFGAIPGSSQQQEAVFMNVFLRRTGRHLSPVPCRSFCSRLLLQAETRLLSATRV